MFKNPLKIIGINPGTRYLGVAIFEGPEPVDWRNKTLKEKWSKEKMNRVIGIISSFIERYEPNILAIKKLHPSRRSENLKRLVVRIKEFSKRKGLKVYQYSIKNLENFFSGEERIKNKKRLAEIVVSEFPVLFHEFKRDKSNRNKYFIRVFEAVALASRCFHHIDRH